MQEVVPGIPGARIEWVAEAPAELADAHHVRTGIIARPGALLAKIPGAGSFYCHDGDTIEVAAEPGADPGHVRLCLNGTARAALIHQRGELPLHAASFVPPQGGAALAIVGPSGAGKSSLGAALSRRGWRLLADDTTRLTRADARILAWPSRDTIKLWKDACIAAGRDIFGLERVAASMDKYYLPVPSHGEPAELRMVFELAGEALRPIDSRIGKMALLSRNTFAQEQIRPLGIEEAHFAIVSAVAGQCAFHLLPGDKSQPPEALAELVERCWSCPETPAA